MNLIKECFIHSFAFEIVFFVWKFSANNANLLISNLVLHLKISRPNKTSQSSIHLKGVNLEIS